MIIKTRLLPQAIIINLNVKRNVSTALGSLQLIMHKWDVKTKSCHQIYSVRNSRRVFFSLCTMYKYLRAFISNYLYILPYAYSRLCIVYAHSKNETTRLDVTGVRTGQEHWRNCNSYPHSDLNLTVHHGFGRLIVHSSFILLTPSDYPQRHHPDTY